MEFIKNTDNNSYSIEDNEDNKYSEYLVHFLHKYDLLINHKNKINFEADTIESLKNKTLSDNLISKFIYDLGYQMLYLKQNNIGIKYFDINDIIIINSNIFIFINSNKLFKLDKSGNGMIDKSSITKSPFIAPELENNYELLHYTCAFYSFAKLILAVFNINLELIYYTQLFFFFQRCLKDNPTDRIFLYV